MAQLNPKSLYNIFNYTERNLENHEIAYQFIKKISKDNSENLVLFTKLDGEKLSLESQKECMQNSEQNKGYLPKMEYIFDRVISQQSQITTLENQQYGQEIQIFIKYYNQVVPIDMKITDCFYSIMPKLREAIQNSDLSTQFGVTMGKVKGVLDEHHQISREDQIDLLMNKACNFPNPNNSSDMDEKISSGNSKKDNDAFNKQVSELNQSIEKMKKKIQVDKKQGSTEASFIKLLKDVRPREFPEALINEDMFKQATKTTRERAEKLMKEWKTLRADLDAFESGM